MRKRSILAAFAAAGLIWLVASTPADSVATVSSTARHAGIADHHHGSQSRSGGLAGGDAAIPMPPQDQRVDAFLAEQTLAPELREQLATLADTQREAFALRDPDVEETDEVRASRRARRDDFRKQVRDVLVAMPAETRASLNRHQVNIVRLAQTIGATP